MGGRNIGPYDSMSASQDSMGGCIELTGTERNRGPAAKRVRVNATCNRRLQNTQAASCVTIHVIVVISPFKSLYRNHIGNLQTNGLCSSSEAQAYAGMQAHAASELYPRPITATLARRRLATRLRQSRVEEELLRDAESNRLVRLQRRGPLRARGPERYSIGSEDPDGKIQQAESLPIVRRHLEAGCKHLTWCLL